jgi:hypothetical protein
MKIPRIHAGVRMLPAIGALYFALHAGLFAFPGDAPKPSEPLRSPVNQVFQFSFTGTCSAWPDGSTTRSAVYLWVPEKCKKIRGLVIMATNVPEHMLVGHPAIRKACEENDLGLVWAVPSFWNFGKGAKGQEKVNVDFLQQLVEGLAKVSGYDEVATVPWLPMGESAHLLMVTNLIDQRPERCIAGVCMKNPQYPKDRSVPMLWSLGTAQEWGQKKSDVRVTWLGKKGWGRDATWPLSGLVEPCTGHFYCTDRMSEYFGKYISAAAKARLSDDGSPALKPVALEKGFLAWLPSQEDENPKVTAYAQTPPGERNKLWFFTEELAKEAQAFARVNWKAETQMPAAVSGVNCTVEPFTFQDSISLISVTTASEFSITGSMLDKIPEGFVGAGEKLAVTPGAPEVDWICGPMAPLGNGKFKIALDRSYKAAANYLVIKKEGTPTIRYSLQPVAIKLNENVEGNPQKITFDKISDVRAGTVSVPLRAKSDSGLPVEFYVEYGPAIIKDGKLVFTPIPPRSRFPVEVSVAAWQWGTPKPPKVKTAEIVKQKFLIQSGR